MTNSFPSGVRTTTVGSWATFRTYSVVPSYIDPSLRVSRVEKSTISPFRVKRLRSIFRATGSVRETLSRSLRPREKVSSIPSLLEKSPPL